MRMCRAWPYLGCYFHERRVLEMREGVVAVDVLCAGGQLYRGVLRHGRSHHQRQKHQADSHRWSPGLIRRHVVSSQHALSPTTAADSCDLAVTCALKLHNPFDVVCHRRADRHEYVRRRFAGCHWSNANELRHEDIFNVNRCSTHRVSVVVWQGNGFHCKAILQL